MPCRCDLSHRVAPGWLDPDDARAELEQLAARERARQVPGEVDDEDSLERPHRDEEAISVDGRYSA